jgi:MFS family permease
MAAEKLLPWAKPLLVSSTLTQATIYVLRPMITYRAIELDGNSAQIGLIAAIYALFPVLLALQFGSWVGKLGEAKFIIYGTLAMMVTSGALIFANNLVTLGIATAAAGLAHLACMVGGQSMVSIHLAHRLAICWDRSLQQLLQDQMEHFLNRLQMLSYLELL